MKYFLGIKVARNSQGIYLSQQKYALDITFDVGLLCSHLSTTPIKLNHRIATARGSMISNLEKYHCLIGHLIYLTFTRPKLTYSVRVLAQFMQNPKQEHRDAILQVVRCLKGGPDQSLLFSFTNNLQLYAYCDSDYASCPITRRSLIGYFITLSSSSISWKMKKQHTISRSFVEA